MTSISKLFNLYLSDYNLFIFSLDCFYPPKISGGSFKGIPPFSPGQRITYFCHNTTKVVGQRVNTCKKTGRWKLDKNHLPYCTKTRGIVILYYLICKCELLINERNEE